MANIIKEYDKQEYFKQYVWALENVDLYQAFKDFLSKELALKNNEEAAKAAYEKFIKESNSNYIPKIGLDFMNYVMKYQNSSYEVGDTIVELDEPSSDKKTFNLYEPGYYFVELYGPSGRCLGQNINQYIPNVGESYKTFFNGTVAGESEILLRINREFKFNLQFKKLNKYQIIKGYIEANDDYVFFYECDHDLKDKLFDSKDSLQESLDTFIDGENIGGTIFDFGKFETNPLKENFYTIHLNKNNLDLRMVDYGNTEKYICGELYKKFCDAFGGEEAVNELLKKEEDNFSQDELTIIKNIFNEYTKRHFVKGSDYYVIKIFKNMCQLNCKCLTFNSILVNDNENMSPPSIFNENALHGGDGGYIGAVIYLDKSDTISYNVGKYDATNGVDCTTYLRSEENKFEIFAEKGGDATANEYAFYLKNQNIDNIGERPSNSSIFEDISSKDFSKKLNFHIGENYGLKKENDKGCGFGSFCKFNDEGNGLISLHHFIGGGQEGEGIRLNEFDVAYYQKPKNGKIKITYLGTKYSKKKPLSIDVVDNNNIKAMNSLYIGDGFVPISANIHNKLGIYGDVIGGFDVSLNGKPDNKLIKNKSRKLNYIDFDIDYLTLDNLKDDENNILTFDLKSERKYIKLRNDKDNFTIVNDDNESLDTDAYFESLHDPLVGFEGDDREYSFMMKKSVTFNDYLNTAYNNGPTFSIRDFNTSSYRLDYTVSDIDKNVKIFNIFEDLIVVSFVYANTLDLPSYNDHLGNPIYKPLPNAGIKKLEYFVYDRDTSPIEYIEKTNIYLPKNAKMALKFSFNTSRIRLDESLTSLVGYNKFYKKNVSLDNETILDSYYNHDVGPDFQFVEFEPDVSQKCQVFIKKNTYSIKILPDLYYQLTPNLVFNKTEYEVGEYISISINLKNYERISNLKITNNSNGKNNYKYVPEESESEFESYFKFSEIQNKCYNIVDNYIASFLNRQKAIENPKDPTYENGLFVVSNRNIKDSIYDEDKDFVKEYCFNKVCCVPTEDSVLKDENVIIYIYMKDSDIELRFTDNYCPGQDLTVLEQGESEYVSFFKTYNFLLKACGGITGNGENGSDQKTSRHTRFSNNGTCGGDGYVGGEGGDGGDAVHWDLGVSRWTISVLNHTVFRAWHGLRLEGPSGGAGGIGGRGFIKSGSSGLNGTHTMGAKYASYYNDAYRLPTDAMKNFKERRDAVLNTFNNTAFLNILSNRNLIPSDYDEIFYSEFNTRGIFYSIYEKLSSSISKDYELAKSYARKEYSKHKSYFYRVYEFHGYYYFIINGQARKFVQTGMHKIAETNEYITSGYIGGNLGRVYWTVVEGYDNYEHAIYGTRSGYAPTNLESTNPYLDCNSNNHCLDEDTNRLIELKIHLFRLQQEYNKLMKNSYKDYLHPTNKEVPYQTWFRTVYKTIKVYDKSAGDSIWSPYILNQKNNIRKDDSYIDLIIREDYITKYMKEWLESHKSFIKNSLTLDVDSMIKCDKTNYRSEIINRILHTIIEKAYIKLYKRCFPSSALRVPYYVGIPFVEKVKINVQKAREGNNLIYLKSGNNGYSFSGNALEEFAGKGGGQGLPSFIKILSKDMSINILNDSNFKSKFRKLYNQSFGMSKTINGAIKNLIFEGGIIGATRTQKAECDTFSSLWGWTAFHSNLDPKPKERNCDPNNIQKYRNEYEWLNLQTVNLYENGKFNCYESLEEYSRLMLTLNYDKKLFDEKYFSSVGYDLFNNNDIIKDDIKKFNGFSDFDKNYKVNEFKDNTYILYNCRKNLLNNAKGELDIARNTYEAEDKLVDEYILSLNFKGKTSKSYETGIINLTVFNEDDIKKDANSFITGQVENAKKITDGFFSDYNNVSKT